jgi:2-polyprenyl-6-hydroxyphenyl methylase/3-demethylubiquinone-9 3-methyltransferase
MTDRPRESVLANVGRNSRLTRRPFLPGQIASLGIAGTHTAIGPRVRACLGPVEIPAANLYRACFVDLGHLARRVRDWSPAPSILEIGCGEGALTEKLSLVYPQARIMGIDITPRVGRLFRGDRQRVTFAQETTQELVAAKPACFDLIVICDVMHHVPWDFHEQFLTDAAKGLKAGGRLVFKEWERRTNLAHLFCYLSDRYITGDQIRYRSASELRTLVQSIFGPGSIEQEIRIPPWRNNVAYFVKT